jgi:hypothetical protein
LVVVDSSGPEEAARVASEPELALQLMLVVVVVGMGMKVIKGEAQALEVLC